MMTQKRKVDVLFGKEIAKWQKIAFERQRQLTVRCGDPITHSQRERERERVRRCCVG